MTTVLLGGLGTTTRVWAAQLPVVADALPLDLPGHGDEPLPGGPVTIESIARSVLHRAPERFSFVGLSIGGMVGQWLGAHAADRVDKLILACTGAKLGKREEYRARAELVRREGTEAVVDGARERWFTPRFRHDPRAEAILDELRGISAEGYAACAEAVGDWDFRGREHEIGVPTLVVWGRDDPTTPPEVRAALARFEDAIVPGAHLANVESPAEFNDKVRFFL
jgi:3-oxoadipate enol-lactonase